MDTFEASTARALNLTKLPRSQQTAYAGWLHIVILDNLASHKAKAVREAVQGAGARLWFLPPYSLDLNPIEQAFAKIKHWMRNAQRRNVEDTWRHLGHSSAPSSPASAITTSETSDMLPSKTDTP